MKATSSENRVEGTPIHFALASDTENGAAAKYDLRGR